MSEADVMKGGGSQQIGRAEKETKRSGIVLLHTCDVWDVRYFTSHSLIFFVSSLCSTLINLDKGHTLTLYSLPQLPH